MHPFKSTHGRNDLQADGTIWHSGDDGIASGTGCSGGAAQLLVEGQPGCRTAQPARYRCSRVDGVHTLPRGADGEPTDAPPPQVTMAEMTPAPGCNGTTMRTITPGSGKEITKGSTATVHATGVVKESGQKFWSTKDPGQEPFTYQAGVGGVIKGWDQGCLGMTLGEVRELVIPADEGYGANGFPAWGIPPGGTLNFTLECLDVQ